MTSGVKKVKTLKQARIELKLTQQQLAEVLAISSSTVHRLEVGRMKPSIGLHEKINKLFGAPVSILHKSMKHENQDADGEKMIMTEGERRFLKTCWNMRDTLRDERMIVRDLVDATYEFMESCEVIADEVEFLTPKAKTLYGNDVPLEEPDEDEYEMPF